MKDTGKKEALLAILGPMKLEKKKSPKAKEPKVGEAAEEIAAEEAFVAIENKDSAGFASAMKAFVRSCMASGYGDEEEEEEEEDA